MKLPLISRLCTSVLAHQKKLLWVVALGLVLSWQVLHEVRIGPLARHHVKAMKVKDAGASLPSARDTADEASARRVKSPSDEANMGEKESLMAAFAPALLQIQAPDAVEVKMPGNQGVRFYISNPFQGLSARFTDEGAILGSDDG
jgi:hypothetical protein